MSPLVLHSATQKQYQSFIQAPSHAVLLLGPSGSGKLALAKQMLEPILSLSPGTFDSYLYAIVSSPQEGKAIGIEVVREMEHFLSLKVPSHAKFNRAIIVEDSHKLTIEAQNALLKTLEEPPEGTIIVLTANHAQSLLPTIRSRAQAVAVKSPGIAALQNYFVDNGASSKDVTQAYAISGGLPGLMSAMLNDSDHPLKEATLKAKELLSQSTYERLVSIDNLSKQKDLTGNLLFILQQMAHVSLRTSTGPAAKKWQSILEASYEATQKLSVSAQPKLVLTDLMLNI